MSMFCPACRRRLSGSAPCPCSVRPAPAPPALGPVPAASIDLVAQLDRGRRKRAIGLSVLIVAAVAGLVAVIAVSANAGRSPVTAAGVSYSGSGTYAGTDTAPSGGSAADGDPLGAGGTGPADSSGPGGPSSDSADARSRLAAYVAQDRPRLLADATDVWIVQLSSKKVGTQDRGVTYDVAAILADHETLRGRYADVRLVWSGDWSSFRYGDYWVTVKADPFASAAAANSWCAEQGLSEDDCFAKRLRTSGGYQGNTQPR